MLETNKLEVIESDFPYQDILYLEHPNPRKHPRQSDYHRAGQFSPFAALSGYDGQIAAVSRVTTQKKILSDSEKEKLDEQLQIIQKNKNITFKITYFEKDLKKNGGRYLNKVSSLHRVDLIHHLIILKDKSTIKMQDIVKIEIIELSD